MITFETIRKDLKNLVFDKPNYLTSESRVYGFEINFKGSIK